MFGFGVRTLVPLNTELVKKSIFGANKAES
jgi:hypothetical protein